MKGSFPMSTERILVVDDEEPIREIVTAMLESSGYQCQQAASGKQALALLTSGDSFELMLSDLMMADRDGIGLLERTKEKYPDMPVVMVTAVHDISVALAAIRNGAYDYLLKPFEREQLLNTVSRALENRRLKVENRNYQTNLESLVKARTDQLQTAMANLERSYDITLEALGDALDLQDRETEGHSRREEIPLGARIFSVADTFDAITSDRPYRPAQLPQAARVEIEKFSGRQFDPEIVKVFLEISDKIWDDLRKEIDGQRYRAAYS